MFTTGQWTFAAIFFVSFVIIAYFVYKKDKPTHQREYKGSYKVLLGFLFFIAMLFVIKLLMKH
ncbi:MAG: hypothetical protein M0D53_15205 [Flavobacterium sp. JAD_PAG50586_2]|jgi:hypothetical protein|nr:MAG: hypothetical protein M0D53_15205 [Flavobacterium sp. JAD_PAG50586_2]